MPVAIYECLYENALIETYCLGGLPMSAFSFDCDGCFVLVAARTEWGLCTV